ncbi:hypothetical protein CHUAL_000317 [Chamberlinius hualienensis]
MTTESALKFGPEWLRALSQGNGTTSATITSLLPPSSPEIPKYKLAEHRYGREEMLALFSKDLKMPRELRQFTTLSRELCQLPLALTEFTEEEQKLWSRSVNSEAVLRVMGRSTAGVTGPPSHRGGRGGGSVDRGRGRGRAPFYQRGLSSEEFDLPPPGGLTRQRSYERSNSDRNTSWEDDYRDRKYDKPFSVRDEDATNSLRKDGFSSALDWRSGNLRANHIREDDENGRKGIGSWSDKRERSNWRNERDDRHPEVTTTWSRGQRTPFRKSMGGRLRDDDFNGDIDSLPEWSVEDNKDAEKVGTFDATGAFLETKEDKESEHICEDIKENVSSPTNSRVIFETSSECSSISTSQENSDKSIRSATPKLEIKNENSGASTKPNVVQLSNFEEVKTVKENVVKERDLSDYPVQPSSTLPVKTEIEPIPPILNHPSAMVLPQHFEKKEDINFEHLEKAAESLVDTIEDDDDKVDIDSSSDVANSWFYRDPQGMIQGPFTEFEMAEWYRTGYFDLSLMVRKGLKGRFCTLGELANLRNSMPFLSSPTMNGEPNPRTSIAANQSIRGLLGGLGNPAPLPLPPQLDILNEQEQLRLVQQHLIQQRLLYQQQQQQRFTRQPLQPVLGASNPIENLAALASSQQQQYFLMQKFMAQQQQQQPPANVPRTPPVDNDPVSHLVAQLAASQQSLSLKEEAPSLWNMPTPPQITSRPTPNVGVCWRPTSVWDLDGGVAGHDKVMVKNMMPTEQQILAEEKKKREEELLRLQRDDEERRRRIQEEQEQRERLRLEELRRKQEEEDRREKEELLKKQQLELEERKRKESEERKFREEEERRLKEERLREEQHRKQEEERRKQEELFMQKEQLRLEELKRKEKRRQLEEEEKAKAEHQREVIEMKLRQAETLKKLQDKQKSKQGPAWGGNSVQSTENTLSLAEIQRMQEEKEQQEKINREIQQHLLMQQQQTMQLQQQQLQQQARSLANMTWAERSHVANAPVKSLLEIQKEEAEKLALQKEKQVKIQQQQTVNNNIVLSTAGVWSNSTAHLRQSNSSSSYSWDTDSGQQHAATNGGSYFWEDNMPNKTKGQSWSAASKSQDTHAATNGQTAKSKTSRAKKEEETVMKLFESPKLNVDEFTEWCIEALSELQSTIDVPTFVSFLKDVESPYEVHDYVRQYLGEGKEVHNFTRQFLENRSKFRNQARNKEVEENMWGPARAINPSLSKPQTNESDGNKSGGKKKKKSKMHKIDNTILGFTVHAAMDRINVGDIDHVEDN